MATTSKSEITKPSCVLHDRFLYDCNYLVEFCNKFEKSIGTEQSDSLLEIKIKDLDSRWAKVELSYGKLMLASEKEVSSEFKESAKQSFDSTLDTYYLCMSQIIDTIKTQNTLPRTSLTSQPLPQSVSQDPNICASLQFQPLPQSFPQEPNICIKVPPCDTEIFEGSYEQWPSFRDMFTAVYINQTKLTPVTKLYHLRNKTTGEAGAIVKRYALSHNNFLLAWEALKCRYENKRVLVDNQMKLLFDIPPATQEDSESIRRIQSSVNDSLATLRSLGIEVESWDPILIRLISTKLPDFTLSLWEQSLTSPRELPKWSQMSQFLVDRYETVERLSSIKATKDSFKLSNSIEPKIQTYASQENLNSPCKLCNDNHSLRNCSKFRTFTVQQRVDFIYKNKYCNNCLSSNHLKPKCKSKHSCLARKTSHSVAHESKMVKFNPKF